MTDTTTRRPILYRVIDTVIVAGVGLFVALVISLLFVGCNTPSAPSDTGRQKIDPIPVVHSL